MTRQRKRIQNLLTIDRKAQKLKRTKNGEYKVARATVTAQLPASAAVLIPTESHKLIKHILTF